MLARTLSMVVIAAVCLVPAPDSLMGQVSDLLPPGTRVRVAATRILPRPAIGTVAGWRSDTLLLDIAGRPPLALPLSTLQRAEISRGRKSKVITGGAVGLLVGTVATAAFLGMFCENPDVLCEADEVFWAFTIIAPLPTALGLVIGLATRVERWETVSLTETRGRTSITGVRIGLSLGL